MYTVGHLPNSWAWSRVFYVMNLALVATGSNRKSTSWPSGLTLFFRIISATYDPHGKHRLYHWP